MNNKRVFPRIGREWPLFMMKDGKEIRIGKILNMSLTGFCVSLDNEDIDISEFASTFKLKDSRISPSELIITGTAKWSRLENNEIFLGIEMSKLDNKTRDSLIQYLSRSDRISGVAVVVTQ